MENLCGNCGEYAFPAGTKCKSCQSESVAVFYWHSDASHAWLEVSLKDFPQAIEYVSNFSYTDNRDATVYLEEDADAPAFLAFLVQQGDVSFTFTDLPQVEVWQGRHHLTPGRAGR